MSVSLDSGDRQSGRPTPGTDDARRTAERVAAGMVEHDAAAREAGIRLLEVWPGGARAGLTVQARHLNGHGIAHGGYLFFLADAALAFASNSRGVSSVAAGADVSFLRPARLGDELVAEATERALAGKSGLYDVTVRIADGDVVAEFRGRTRAVPYLPQPG